MKNTILKLSAIAALILSANLSAQTYWYVIGDVKVNIPVATTPAYDCFDPINIGQIGGGGECNGKLIVDNNLLVSLVNSESDYSSNAIFTGQVTDTQFLFYERSVLHDITGWNMSNVYNMTAMFDTAFSFNQNISGWNVSNVVNMRQMFFGTDSFNQDLSSWNFSSVITMRDMFRGSSGFNQDISGWNIPNVSDMDRMFSFTNYSRNISSLCVPLIPSKPFEFDYLSGFEGQDNLQPNWGCN